MEKPAQWLSLACAYLLMLDPVAFLLQASVGKREEWGKRTKGHILYPCNSGLWRLIPLKLCLTHWVKYKTLSLSFEALYNLALIHFSRPLCLSSFPEMLGHESHWMVPFSHKMHHNFLPYALAYTETLWSSLYSFELESYCSLPTHLSPCHTGFLALFCWACSCLTAFAFPISSAWNTLSQK